MKRSVDMDNLITLTDAAKELGVSAGHLRNLYGSQTDDRKPPLRKIHSRWWCDLNEMREWHQRHQREDRRHSPLEPLKKKLAMLEERSLPAKPGDQWYQKWKEARDENESLRKQLADIQLTKGRATDPPGSKDRLNRGAANKQKEEIKRLKQEIKRANEANLRQSVIKATTGVWIDNELHEFDGLEIKPKSLQALVINGDTGRPNKMSLNGLQLRIGKQTYDLIPSED